MVLKINAYKILSLQRLRRMCGSMSSLQRPAPRVASAFPAMTKERHYRQGFQRLSGLNGRFRFSFSHIKTPVPLIIGAGVLSIGCVHVTNLHCIVVVLSIHGTWLHPGLLMQNQSCVHNFHAPKTG